MRDWNEMLIAVAIALLLMSSGAFAQQQPKLRPLRIALPSNTIGATHFYVGKSLGIFESYGFEPQILVLEPRAALAALLTGDLDFYTATGTTTRAALRGVPVRIIMVGLNRPDHALVAAKEITSVEQLRGKVLGGYTAQATVNVILLELMRRKGLRPDEYKILNVGTARLAALTAGNVPAAVLNGLETVYGVNRGFASGESSGGHRTLHRRTRRFGGQPAKQTGRFSKSNTSDVGEHSNNGDAERESVACAYEATLSVAGRCGIDL